MKLLTIILFLICASFTSQAQFNQIPDSITMDLSISNLDYPSSLSTQNRNVIYFLDDKNPLSNNYPKVILPAYCLGAFCKFENYLNYKKKLPINFGTD